ncbi:MAG: hypothetical protein MUQ25_13735 [Candidatus Aminicenantes bacterium]|nr:hypothetical protein [Candidatus Aminicenantes bacterium]
MKTEKKVKKDVPRVRKMVNFVIDPELYRRFKLRTVREGCLIRAVMEAMITAYIAGEFKLVEEKKASLSKG